jgi:small nuclear ribonucleoprotein (snRNP)-like protein
LWGRLNGVEQLLNLVAPSLDERWYHQAFQAVLGEEGPQLPTVGSVIEEIRATLSSQDPQTSGA